MGLAGPLTALAQILPAPVVSPLPVPADSLAARPVHAQKGWHLAREVAVPSVLIAYGAASIGSHRPLGLLWSSTKAHDEVRERYPTFHCTVDEYLQYAPIVAVGALDAFGVRAAHSPAGQATRLIASMGLMSGVVTGLKTVTHVERPSRSSFRSFPSAHAGTAFAAAEFLHQEFRDQPAIVIGGYTVATAVGVMRMLNNKHWLSDVCAGAGIGILSTKIAYYGINHVRWTPRRAARPASSLARTLVLPGYVPGGGATLLVAVRL